MKKNKMSKLTLHKETLRSLAENQMQNVAGGDRTRGANCSANYTDCGSCGIACTAIDCTP